MVGVPKSNGCHLCLARKVRCDEARPSCGNCTKYGADCPGYDRSLKFVAGKHAVRPRRPKNGRARECPPTKSSRAAGQRSAAAAGEKRARSEEGETKVVIMGEGKRKMDPLEHLHVAVSSTALLVGPIAANKSQFIGTMIYNARGGELPADDMVVFRSWFDKALSRLGSTQLLDMAACSFALQMLGKSHKDGGLLAHSRTLYGQSLAHLQRSLDHQEEWKTAETLCSATLLCLFELFAGTTSPTSWMSHAQGVAHLMKLRGPKAHESEWGKSILLSFRPLIVMNAMFSGQDCFLAEPRWQKVTRRDTAADPSVIYDRADFVEDYFQLLARLPPILRDGYMLREANRAGFPVDPTMKALLMTASERLRAEFEAWYPSLLPMNPLPTEIPSRDPGSIYETVLNYKSPWMGSLHMSYWASMIILQECLNQTGYKTNYTASNQLFALNIFRSLETVGAGLMGPYRCGYSLRIAFEVGDPPTQLWLREHVLKEFEKAYAATSVSDYEAISP